MYHKYQQRNSFQMTRIGTHLMYCSRVDNERIKTPDTGRGSPVASSRFSVGLFHSAKHMRSVSRHEIQSQPC